MENFKLINTYIALTFLLVIAGCKRSSIRENKFAKRSSYYVLRIDGVECALCAKKTILALEKISGVLRAEYICNDLYYHDCFVNMYLINKDVSISQKVINDQLVCEGFELVSVTHF